MHDERKKGPEKIKNLCKNLSDIHSHINARSSMNKLQQQSRSSVGVKDTRPYECQTGVLRCLGVFTMSEDYGRASINHSCNCRHLSVTL